MTSGAIIALFFVVLLVLMLSGMPIAYSLGIASAGYMLMSGTSLAMMAQRMVNGANSFTMLAIPFFFMAGELMNISGVLIVAGGVGNLIDRIANGYVVDFLYFRLINFPIFNFADCCVVVGAVLLLIFLFFFYEEKPKSQQEEPAPADSLPATDEGAAEQAPQEEETPHGGEELDRSAGKDGGED